MHFSYQTQQEVGTDRMSNLEPSLTARLYQLYADKLLSYLYRRVSSRTDAEDILCEVFLAVLEQEMALAARNADEQRAWLWVVARNKAFDYQRNLYRRPAVPLMEVEEQVEDEQMIPENMMMRSEAANDLHVHLSRLPESQQEALQLRFIGGLTSAEIAQVLKKREGAVRMLLSRALNTLRRIYIQGSEEKVDD